MKKLLFVLVSLAIVSCGEKKKKEPDPKFYQQATEMANQKREELKMQDKWRFLAGTNRNENVSVSISDSILVVKIISKKGEDYSGLCEFYHDLAIRSGVSVLGTQLRDSTTNKLLSEIKQ